MDKIIGRFSDIFDQIVNQNKKTYKIYHKYKGIDGYKWFKSLGMAVGTVNQINREGGVAHLCRDRNGVCSKCQKLRVEKAKKANILP